MMRAKRWASISLPRELIDRIDDVVAANKHGYTSRADFVSDAVRTKLKEIGYYP